MPRLPPVTSAAPGTSTLPLLVLLAGQLDVDGAPEAVEHLHDVGLVD